MAGARNRRLRARDGGQAQGGDPAVRQLARDLRAALMPQPRGALSRATRFPEWRCTPCGASNWADRSCCRACGKPKGSKLPNSAKRAADLRREAAATAKRAESLTKAAEAKGAAASTQNKQASRPPAPEARAADAEAQQQRWRIRPLP